MKYIVTILATKRADVEVEADSEDQAQGMLLGQLSSGDLPEFSEMYDSISVEKVIHN